MNDSNQPITVTAHADSNFIILLNGYKHLKSIKKIALICVLLITMIPFAWGVSAAAVILTLGLCLGTMAYLVVSMESVISELQRALYSICLRSVSEQVNIDGDVDPSQD